MEKITKSKSTERHYSEREKEQAVANYHELVVAEIHRMYDLYDQYHEQVQHKNFKSEKYDFDLHNQLSFDIEQCKRRVWHATELIQKHYDVTLDVPNFDTLLENYEK